MHKSTNFYSFWLIIISMFFAISGCAKAGSQSYAVGFLSNTAINGPASGVTGIAVEQKSGYEAGLEAASTTFETKNIIETAQQGDIQRTFRDLAEDPQAPLLAILGATSNNASSHAASLANFFNIPMLVPSASGDNLFPSNNLWAFRLSAPGTAYANYLFGSLITKQAMDTISSALGSPVGVVPQLKIAILYEQNTFGESAAVATATAAIAQSIKIGVYSNFKPDNPDPASLKLLANKVKEAGVQLVYLVSSDPGMAKNLVQTFRSVFDAQSMPILVGQAGGFAALDFLGSAQVAGVYVLRQQIDRTNCPANIQSGYDAQSYAAVYLLDQAVQQARTNLAGASKQFSLSGLAAPTALQRREAIRDALKLTNIDVPCLGKVAFDNAGQNKLLKLELIKGTKGQAAANSAIEFLDALKKRLANDLLQ